MKAKPLILIVEEKESILQFLRGLLGVDHDITRAPNARRALELALHHQPDCILVDMVLPNFSGLEFCQTCSTVRFTRRIPVVILNGLPGEKYREICFGLGATEYFENSVAPEKLREYLTRLLTYRPKERRAEDRASLRLHLKLRGFDAHGTNFEAVTTTEEISILGFLCSCPAPLDENGLVEVLLDESHEALVGRARVARREGDKRNWKKYAFRFIEEPRIWLPADERAPDLSSIGAPGDAPA